MAITAARLEAEVTADTSKAEGTLKGFGGKVKGLGGAFTAAKIAASAFMGTAVVGGAVKAIMAASDLNEVTSKTQVTFGGASKAVIANANEMAKAYGIPKSEILDAASGIGLVTQASGVGAKASAGLSNQMANLAADASSFYNVPLDEALAAMKSGLVGEAEPMRAFGVLLSENAVKAEAHRLGIAKGNKELTEGQKVQARASLIMKGMSKAHGDLARTQTSVANRLREIKGRLTNFAAEMGTKALPAVQTFLTWIMTAPQKLKPFLDGLNTAKTYVMAFIDGIRGASSGGTGTFATLVAAGGAVRKAFQDIWTFITTSLIPAFKNIWAIVGPLVGEAFTSLKNIVVGQLLPGLKGAGNFLTGTLGPALLAVTGFLREHATVVRTLIVALVAGLAAWKAWQLAVAVINGVKAALLGMRVAMAAMSAAMAANPIMLVVIALAALAAGLVYAYKHSETFRNIVNGAFNAVKAVVMAVVGWFQNSFVPFFTQTLPNAVKSCVDWIRSHWALILSILTGPIGAAVIFVITHWNQIKTATITAFNAVKSAITTAINAVKSIISKVLSFLGGLWQREVNGWKKIITTVFNAIKSVVSGAINGVKSIISKALSVLSSLWNREVNGWKRIITTIMNAIKSVVSTAVAGIKAAISKISAIAGQIKGYFTAAKNAAAGVINSLVSLARGIGGRIKSAVGSLGSILYSAGKNVIQGLINGVTGMIGSLKRKFSSITSMIPDWKGPRRVDLRLLMPAGKAIMTGLNRGIDGQRKHLRRQLHGVTRMIEGTGGTIQAGMPPLDIGALKRGTIPFQRRESYEYGGIAGPRARGAVAMTFNTYYPRAEPQSVTTNKALQRVGALGLVG